MIPAHEVHDADEGGLELTFAVDEATQHLLVDDLKGPEALFKLVEAGELDFEYVLAEYVLLDALFLEVVVEGLGSPAQQSYYLVAC